METGNGGAKKEDALGPSVSYYLEPGYIYFTRVGATIQTVVGSCVSVCLWDSQLKYGGMNHYLHPATYDAADATPKYGNVAVAALVNMMCQAGCQTADLVAQVLGGAAPEGSATDSIGAQNAEVARRVLARKGVSVASEDVGGNMGRKIIFDTSTGQLITLKVHRLRDDDWVTGMPFARYRKMEEERGSHRWRSA